MAEQLLGVGFEIHGGGSDLVFPHHENEASQTRAARGHELARLWMHNGMVQMTGEKMAKSAGNIAPLHEVLADHGAHAVVMYLISGHYRQPLAFSEAQLAGRRQASCAACARRCGACPRGAEPRGHALLQATTSSPRCATTSTPPPRWPRWTTGSGRPTAAARGSATVTCARCSGSSGLGH